MPAIASDATVFDSLAKYYDKSDLDRSAEIAFYASLIGPQTRSLLELACGTGTITIPLVRRIVEANGSIRRAVGLDASARMLEIARGRGPGIEWLYGDMRTPPVDDQFDLVICCFNGLQLMLTEADLMQVLASARRLTAPGGIFAADLYQPNVQFLNGGHPERIVRDFTDERGMAVKVYESGEYDPQTRVLASVWRLVDSAGGVVATSRFCLRQYFAVDIERALAMAGFTMVDRFGGFDRSPFTPDSKRQVIVCRGRD